MEKFARSAFWLAGLLLLSALHSTNANAQPTGVMLLLRNSVRENQCLFSRAKDDVLDNFECHPDYVDQHFELVEAGAGNVLIKSRDTEKCLFSDAVPNVFHEACDSSNVNQQFQIVAEPDTEAVRFKSAAFDKCLYLNDANEEDIGIWDCTFGDQLWFLDPVITFPVNTPVMIENKKRGQCLYARTKDDTFGAFDCHPEYNDQYFQITQVKDTPYFRIKSEDTGKCLFSYADSTWGMWDCVENYKDQYWLIRDNGDGSFMLKGIVSEKCAYMHADRSKGVFDCVVDYNDQHWKFQAKTQ
jgi:hypothetical protein